MKTFCSSKNAYTDVKADVITEDSRLALEKYFLLAVNLKLLSRHQNHCVKKKKKMVSRKNIR